VCEIFSSKGNRRTNSTLLHIDITDCVTCVSHVIIELCLQPDQMVYGYHHWQCFTRTTHGCNSFGYLLDYIEMYWYNAACIISLTSGKYFFYSGLQWR
jgi:hypothetical protein